MARRAVVARCHDVNAEGRCGAEIDVGSLRIVERHGEDLAHVAGRRGDKRRRVDQLPGRRPCRKEALHLHRGTIGIDECIVQRVRAVGQPIGRRQGAREACHHRITGAQQPGTLAGLHGGG